MKNSTSWSHFFIVTVVLTVISSHVGVQSFSLTSTTPNFLGSNMNGKICPTERSRQTPTQRRANSLLMMAQVSQKEAQTGIDKVVKALRSDKTAKSELGNLVKVQNILGYGSPKPDVLAVRFNASFQKGGMGRSAVPLPFGLGQSNKSEGRGTMVGQVKASLDAKTGKILECSVFRDLGYGRAFNLKV
mmetsp:Transcript_21920/g.32289  ORF Transcript_21920/g.32289 Transcript_21920/m.32289 type:complete len:188 (-) Transcript_21920:254-817(-)